MDMRLFESFPATWALEESLKYLVTAVDGVRLPLQLQTCKT
jgi:hypothetical protein